jgi:hypothetical protein
MKRGHILFITCLILTSLTSAIPTLNFQHEQTQVGETIIATITTPGEFTKQIEPEDLEFYQGRKKTSFESDIVYYHGTHYLYIYTTRVGNFTIQIEDILYKELDMLQSTTIIKEINITEKTNETLTIKPGFIFTTQTPTIKFLNTGLFQLNLTYNDNETSLLPSQTKEITLDPEEVFSYLDISTYKEFSVPIIYFKADENTTFISPSVKADLRSNPELLFLELFTENETQSIIEIFNFGDENITDIKATHNTSFLTIEEIQNLPPRGIQNLTLTFQPENPGNFQDKINITYTQNQTQQELQISLSIFVLPKGEPIENFEVKEETCQEMSGKVCEDGYLCNGTATFTKNSEYCCLATCVELENTDPSDSSGFGWLIGIVILAILSIGGYALYKKQKAFKPQTSKDKLNEVSKKFEKRLSGESNRIRGGLTKS